MSHPAPPQEVLNARRFISPLPKRAQRAASQPASAQNNTNGSSIKVNADDHEQLTATTDYGFLPRPLPGGRYGPERSRTDISTNPTSDQNHLARPQVQQQKAAEAPYLPLSMENLEAHKQWYREVEEDEKRARGSPEPSEFVKTYPIPKAGTDALPDTGWLALRLTQANSNQVLEHAIIADSVMETLGRHLNQINREHNILETEVNGTPEHLLASYGRSIFAYLRAEFGMERANEIYEGVALMIANDIRDRTSGQLYNAAVDDGRPVLTNSQFWSLSKDYWFRRDYANRQNGKKAGKGKEKERGQAEEALDDMTIDSDLIQMQEGDENPDLEPTPMIDPSRPITAAVAQFAQVQPHASPSEVPPVSGRR
ncbi:hypothetical protein BT69DRAFT_1285132 [Atractiella rhizophila]|nr:hypothetical protein BT69DRAFT_1285132 [Atractiella rhizophila]